MNIIKKVLNKKYDFKYNQVLNRVEFKLKKESEFAILDDYKFNSIHIELLDQNYRLSKTNLRTLLESSFSKPYNPFDSYFNSLPKWNGEIDYIKSFSESIDTQNNKDFQWAFKKWFVAMVACAKYEDITNHTVLILSGDQGVGKSTWLKSLIPPFLKSYYFSGNINPNDKDTVLQLSENLIVNMDELASFDKKQIEGFKELITRPSSRVRRAYGHFAENYKRRASFVGSTNQRNILTDTSGNRRFLVFEMKKYNSKKTIKIDLLYSQALELLKTDFRYYFNQVDIERIEKNNENFVQISSETELISRHYQIPTLEEKIWYMSATELIEDINSNSNNRHYNLNAITVGKELSAMGFTKSKKNGLQKYEVSKRA